MKNRKFVVVAFLLVAVLLLGVGYAALTDTLDVTGSADVNLSELNNEFNHDVYFVGAEHKNDGDTTSINKDNNDKVSFTVNSLKSKGDTAVFTYTIANIGPHEVTVTPKIAANGGNTNTEYFEISSDWNGQPKILAAAPGTKDGEGNPIPSKITYEVTVKLLKDPTVQVSGSFIIELTATAGDPASAPGETDTTAVGN